MKSFGILAVQSLPSNPKAAYPGRVNPCTQTLGSDPNPDPDPDPNPSKGEAASNAEPRVDEREVSGNDVLALTLLENARLKSELADLRGR